ncbi:hypothetical protein GGU10DRAFT_299453 [Lentinula aff. detonsa]|uniref:Uncharacterized protein n=1 Tax=Lentinula aff. detonsa TaxID=2804958 RepID=A0AA38NNV0_9AGAR|nr:hypothetical protein GGU10DRAFT_299453 [Lentinula aff. detonsa]
MGFFSSRKTDGDFVVHDREGTKAATTMVKVIRSRFYGKHKAGAERTHVPDDSGTFISQDGSTASTLGHPGQNLRKSQSTPFTTTIRKASGSSRLKNTHTSSSINLRSAEPFNARNSGVFESSEFHVQAGTLSSKITYGRPDTSSTASAIKSTSAPPTPVSTRTSRTDNATMTLAQRLNELAIANDEGLLNDDEYRILRQNLFERFAGNATVPTEDSIVPASVTPLRRPQRGNATTSENRTSFSSSRLSSNFNVDIIPSSSVSPRSPSIRSVKTGVASLLHRATNRGANRDKSDTSSIYSITSSASNAFNSQSPQNYPHTRVGSQAGSMRSLRKKTSNSSIGTEASVSKKGQSQSQADAISLSSRTSRNRTGLGLSQHPERSPSDIFSPQTPSRSAASSLRRLAVPPSSFSPKGLHSSNPEPTGKREKAQDIYDDASLVTSADIKREIVAVEAEGRRLVDAFNGLEVTTLAKGQRRHLGHHRVEIRPATIVGLPGDGAIAKVETGTGGGGNSSAEVGVGSTWTLIPDNKLHFRATPAQTPALSYLDADVISIRSGTSAHTSHTGRSIPRSAHRDASRTLPSKPSSGSVSGSGTGSLHRKNSSSSLASSTAAGKKRAGGGGGLSPIPPLPTGVPPLPSGLNGLSNLALASGSSLNLARSTGHLPMSSVPEDEDVDPVGLEPEMDEEIREIRKKKLDVSKRYEERLEYLRAKLKGAQLHEKLMKK